jgi:hypothetical protein
MGFRAQWRISAAFLPQFRGMFSRCSSHLNLWITLCRDRIGEIAGEVTGDSPF